MLGEVVFHPPVQPCLWEQVQEKQSGLRVSVIRRRAGGFIRLLCGWVGGKGIFCREKG